MHTITNRQIHAALNAGRRRDDDIETVAPLRKEDAGAHDRPYTRLEVLLLKFVGLVLARRVI